MNIVENLVIRLREGDETAFEEFVTQYERPVYNLALRQLGNPDDAQDAAQEVFLRVYRSVALFRADSRLSTWVYQITVNVCTDMLRKYARHPETSLNDGEEEDAGRDLPDETYAPEPLYERTALREQVQAALGELSPEHRQIIVLRDITGLRYDEIAGVLQLSGGTVKSRLYRAREKLASILRRMGNNSDPAASNGQTAGMQGR